MKIDIDFKQAANELERKIKKVEQKLPYLTMRALNETAYKTRELLQEDMRHVFVNPTPWVLRSIKYWKAGYKKVNGEKKWNMSAGVYINEYNRGATAKLDASAGQIQQGTKPSSSVLGGSEILAPHIFGGSRKMRMSESRLFNAYMYPGRAAKTNQYGNIPASEWSRMRADIPNQYWDPYSRTKQGKQQYFMISSKGRKIVMRRTGKNTVVPYFIEGRAPTYKKRWNFFGTAKKVSDKIFIKKLEYKLAQINKTI